MSKMQSVALVRVAMDLGVNLLDTAAAYGTENIVGEAIKPVPRESVVVATKAQYRKGGAMVPVSDVVASLENSLRELNTDYVDIFQFHAVRPQDYALIRDEYAPALLREKEKGKLRHLGLTETPPNDPDNTMAKAAVQDEIWESIMLGFHMMHRGPRKNVFPYTQANGIGTLAMFVVRGIFSIPGRLASTMADLARDGLVPDWPAETDDPLGFLVRKGGADSVIDAAYRYARHEPGTDVIFLAPAIWIICAPIWRRHCRRRMSRALTNCSGVSKGSGSICRSNGTENKILAEWTLLRHSSMLKCISHLMTVVFS